ncbi:asparagine-linked glycosylation protein [Tulasnella sp. 403]|nr:asparagine-linked glycosylation protein [Tulasnella sp. 403]
MGYAFTFPLVSILGRFLYRIPIGAYVHYPTISTDMLERVRNRKTGYANKDDVTSSWLKSTAKLIYYRIFAFLYSTSLLQADTIVVNSSWTKSHIDSLINSARKRLGKTAPGKTSGVEIVYPPCHMDKLREFPLQGRERVILSVAQFRPEKEHEVQIRAFHSLLTQHPNLRNGSDAVRLVLLGGCRTEEDEKRVEILKRLTEELGLEASGLIPLVHDSGGPKLDIVLPYHSQSAGLTLPTGYHATSSESYATALANIFVETNASDIMDMRERARTRAVERFGRDEFERGWVAFWDSLRAQGTALGGRTEDSLKDQ